MDENEKNTNSRSKVTTLIRAVICVLVMAVIILNWVDIIPITVSIVTSTVLLCGVTMWNAVEAVKDKRKGSAILNFILFALLAGLCAAAFILKFK